MPRVRKDKKFPDVFVTDYACGIREGDRCKVICNDGHGFYYVVLEPKPYHHEAELRFEYKHNYAMGCGAGIDCAYFRILRGV